MKINEYIGSKIKEFRTKKNITQGELGDYLKTTSQTISRYESGVLGTNQDVLYKLAEFFKVSVNDFFPPIDGTTSDILGDHMYKENTSITQLSIITGIKSEEIKDIYLGRNKFPKPSTLIKLANALDIEPILLISGSGYVDDESFSNYQLYETGVRYILNMEEREILCNYLVEYWNRISKRHKYNYNEVYTALFSEDKNEFSINEIRNILAHGINDKEMYNIVSKILNEKINNNE